MSSAEEKKVVFLFWIYRDVDLCLERLKILRIFNPSTPIYILYGGERNEAERFKRILRPHVDSFYAFMENRDSHWKWCHGEQLITAWYRDVGSKLVWTNLAIIQWDLLIFEKIDRLVCQLGRESVVLTGLRPIREVASWWHWLKPELETSSHYNSFCTKLHSQFQFDQREALACQFTFGIFPRRFVDEWSRYSTEEDGFLEYTIPMYAQALKFKVIDAGKTCLWPDDPAVGWELYSACTLRAGREIGVRRMARNLLSGSEPYLFHPFWRSLPPSLARIIKGLVPLLKIVSRARSIVR